MSPLCGPFNFLSTFSRLGGEGIFSVPKRWGKSRLSTEATLAADKDSFINLSSAKKEYGRREVDLRMSSDKMNDPNRLNQSKIMSNRQTLVKLSAA